MTIDRNRAAQVLRRGRTPAATTAGALATILTCAAPSTVLPVIERDDVVVIGGDDDGSMRTAPLGVLSGAVVVSVTGSSPR